MAGDTPIRFWEKLSLDQMSDEQWESLCDGCGRCCLQKLEDIDSGSIYFTQVSCRLLDINSCRCRSYADRFNYVPDCTQVRPLTPQKLSWLPTSCAYRLIAENKPLPQWHPLISGDKQTVHTAGISVREIALCETKVDVSEYQQYVIHFDLEK